MSVPSRARSICPSAITLAGYLLGATRRIAVGTAVSVLSTQHPVALAGQAALLDQLSGGRFRLGRASVTVPAPWRTSPAWPPRSSHLRHRTQPLSR
ncbi:MAG: LLM class flavin-dependent oxidoreductase [Pseudonocardiales bacterium]|nr:LLM class flavin-dependent oxidoreductase [Pseudonocardiales bacterium]MBV9729991.1 LLM class flavin-dependent oxidoreductase [Pseudonocardiales bacterium]